jgi:hypothetical protein
MLKEGVTRKEGFMQKIERAQKDAKDEASELEK